MESLEDTNTCWNSCPAFEEVSFHGQRFLLWLMIIMHLWDMATDVGVLVNWLPGINWNDPFSTDKDNTFYYVVGSVMAMLIYRVVSGIMYGRKYSPLGGLLQFLDIMLFVEVYASLQGARTKSTLQLRWIRRMEAVLESAPQSFLQLIYLLRTKVYIQSINQTYKQTNKKISLQVSLFMSLLSIANSVVKSDDWNFKQVANSKCPPHPVFLLRGTFRLAEIVSRLLIVALLTQTANFGFIGTMCIFLVESFFPFFSFALSV
ncbi:hypothetical protein RFI_17653 [Reticulomyxa filosa]|uniref:Uncharacterized protein n=1 Tax=Reticulomyxa filosa TaxID=46433 RepID=X6N2N8_RETFI|nr:hypothetical protein RFI_17653 [Reticulomyxa filosa]|eukprot:ETO19577.1 hypothetical protein RFI_17653 [Reticulomyxa filosa]